MKKIFWRVLVYFGIVLLLFTVMIGLLFYRFNRNNIVGAYKEQLNRLATGVAKRTSTAVKDKESDSFYEYLSAVEDFTKMQNIDIWILSNPKEENAMDSDFTNADISVVAFPQATNEILNSAFEGKKKNYSAYDEIYQNTMLHLAVPIRDKSGVVIGAVLVSGPMKIQESTIVQYEKYLIFSLVVGLFVAILLALYFSRQLVQPIIKIKEAALVMAAGKYDYKTNVQRKDELGSLADSMNVLSERLVEAEELREGLEQSRRDFFSKVSHELRTPITVVKGYADTLADGMIEDSQKEEAYIERIQRECESMERLVSDLLILSRMQNPDYELNMEVLNIIAVAQDAMRSIRILMEEKKLKGMVTFDDMECMVEGDYDRIRQLFTILLQNAVKYSYEGTEISVHVWKKERYVIADVKDYGSVIPKEEWENIFEKFYRASNHGAKEGSGLGLMVAKNIVERHGGKISVTSSEEEGSCFRVEFPETSEKIS